MLGGWVAVRLGVWVYGWILAVTRTVHVHTLTRAFVTHTLVTLTFSGRQREGRDVRPHPARRQPKGRGIWSDSARRQRKRRDVWPDNA